MRIDRRVRPWAALLVSSLLVASGCGREPPAESVVWATGAGRGVYGGGDVVTHDGTIWIAYAEGGQDGPTRVRLRRAGGDSGPASAPVVASFDGGSPGLAALPDGSFVLVTAAPGGTIVLRRGTGDGRTWSAPERVSPPPDDCTLEPGRFTSAPRGTWIVPAVRGTGAATSVVCFLSADAGKSWREVEVLRAPEAAAPAVAALQGDALLLVARIGTQLVRCESSNGGSVWSGPQPLGIVTGEAPSALEGLTGGAALAWTDPAPDSTWAAPGLRAVRLAVSADGGSTWRQLAPLAWRAGDVPSTATLAFDGTRLTALVAASGRDASGLACVAYDLRQLEPAVRLPVPERARGRYALDVDRAADALALLSAHTLARSEPSKRLFIEGYFMRSLVAAHDVLGGRSGRFAAGTAAHGLDTERGVLQAVALADWLVDGQDVEGYWPLGYKAVYVADMAAVVGLLAAVAPHVEPGRARRYTVAAQRFAAALERDGMRLANGAYGIGWPLTRVPSESTAIRDAYAVSTALAGIEVNAWLFARTGESAYREHARAALDWTLSQLQPDGSYPDLVLDDAREGAFAIAAYVQEGWMAADVYLHDDAVLARLRQALPTHVAWLLRTQRPDGLWGATSADGEWARTPSILDFLVWYDARCASSPEVRLAVRRASAVLLDPDRWRDVGLGRAGKNEEVLRALAGRALAAMAGEKFVP